MKKIIICLLFFTMILTSCFTQKQSNNGEKSNKIDKEASESIKNEEGKINDNNANNTSENKLTESSNEVTQDINTNTINNNANNTSENKSTQSSDEVTQDINTNNTNLDDMEVKVKEYILNGQGEKPEAKKINWSNSFLEQVNLKEIYDNYLADGGTASNVEWFAKYITSYAPIPINWEEIFKKDLYEAYGEQVVKLELIEGDLYQAYVEKEGKEVPYVVVSARTGYFHG